MPQRIMVPLDGTRFAEAALPHAMYLAKRDDASLQLAMVWQRAPHLVDTPAWLAQVEAWEREKREQDRAYMTDIARRVGEAIGRPVLVKYLVGRPENELTAWAVESEVDLVVMSTHGRGPVTRAWLGSVADRMVRRAAAPVMLIRPPDSELAVDLVPIAPWNNVLVPLDGSELSRNALQKAVLLGNGAARPRITLLRVVSFPYPTVAPDGTVVPPFTTEQERSAAAWLARVAAEHTASWGCEVDTQVLVEAITWKAIGDYAALNGFDLIAMSTHGRGGAARLLLGSVADKVMRTSSVPVLLFHPPLEEGEESLQKKLAADALVAWP